MNALVLNYSTYAYNYCRLLASFNINADVTTEVKSPDNYDFLLLCGGGDVSPRFYGGHNINCTNVNIARDITEFSQIERFVRSRKKIIGICRGIQVLNAYFGGTLTTLPKENTLHTPVNDTDLRHEVVVSPHFAHIFPEKFTVNSYHRQCINSICNEFEPMLLSPDGVIEAVVGKTLPIVAFQFHPERMVENFRISGKSIFSFAISFKP